MWGFGGGWFYFGAFLHLHVPRRRSDNRAVAECPIVLSQHLLLFIPIFSLHHNPHAYSVCRGQSEGLRQDSAGRCRLLHLCCLLTRAQSFLKKREDKSHKATDHASRFHGAESSATNIVFRLSPIPPPTKHSNVSFILLWCATVLKVDSAKESWPCIFNHSGCWFPCSCRHTLQLSGRLDWTRLNFCF